MQMQLQKPLAAINYHYDEGAESVYLTGNRLIHYIKEGNFCMASCDFCAYNEYDEEDEAYYCSVNMDEDDMARFVQSNYKECPFYRSGDEYKVVRHQM